MGRASFECNEHILQVQPYARRKPRAGPGEARLPSSSRFDYNVHTFKPTQSAEIIASEEVGLGRLGALFPNEKLKNKSLAALVKYKTFEIVIPITFSVTVELKTRGNTTPMEDTPELARRNIAFDSIKLTSSVFSKWDASAAEKNLAASLSHVLGLREFEEVISNALALRSKKPRHKIGIVAVEAMLGLGLGEIGAFNNFRYIAMERAAIAVKEWLAPNI